MKKKIHVQSSLKDYMSKLIIKAEIVSDFMSMSVIYCHQHVNTVSLNETINLLWKRFDISNSNCVVIQLRSQLSFTVKSVWKEKSFTSIINMLHNWELCNCNMWKRCIIKAVMKLINSEKIRLTSTIFFLFETVVMMTL